MIESPKRMNWSYGWNIPEPVPRPADMNTVCPLVALQPDTIEGFLPSYRCFIPKEDRCYVFTFLSYGRKGGKLQYIYVYFTILIMYQKGGGGCGQQKGGSN